jgi:hypothetical protein
MPIARTINAMSKTTFVFFILSSVLLKMIPSEKITVFNIDISPKSKKILLLTWPIIFYCPILQ